jgi:hypothetical protein
LAKLKENFKLFLLKDIKMSDHQNNYEELQRREKEFEKQNGEIGKMLWSVLQEPFITRTSGFHESQDGMGHFKEPSARDGK